MRKVQLLALCAAAALVAVAACKRVPTDGTAPTGEKPQPSGPAPKLVFTEMSHDFGTVVSGDTVEHVFHFRNDGEGELRLEQPRGS